MSCSLHVNLTKSAAVDLYFLPRLTKIIGLWSFEIVLMSVGSNRFSFDPRCLLSAFYWGGLIVICSDLVCYLRDGSWPISGGLSRHCQNQGWIQRMSVIMRNDSTTDQLLNENMYLFILDPGIQIVDHFFFHLFTQACYCVPVLMNQCFSPHRWLSTRLQHLYC